jgi:serine/threonine protein kinase
VRIPKIKEGKSLETMFPEMTPEMIDLLSHCLALDPNERWTAEQCLQHPYFDSLGDEIQEKIKMLSMIESEIIFHQFKKIEREDEKELIEMSKQFCQSERDKDDKGEFMRKLKGGSEPEAKFSNLEKESSYFEEEEDEEEEPSDAEFNMS